MDLSIPSKNALLVISIHMFYNILHIIFPFSPERSLTGMYIRKIVLADDEGTQLKILSSLIHKLTPQTELVLCSDGYAAWEAVQAGDTELLITDIRMPSMDGIELIRQVSEAYPMTAIVLISAWQEFDYAQSAIACGVSEYLVKPFRVEDIRKLLSKMETKISSMQKEQERSLGYEALLEQHIRESRQSLLLSLMYGRPCGETTFESPLLHSLSASLSSPGVMAVLRWEVRPGSSSASSPFALSRPRMETLTEYIHRLFPTDFLVPLDNSLSSSERRLALLLPGFSLAGCISSFERLISLCRAEDIVFQAGLSKEHPDLFAALNTALCQAEEALSFSFYFPGKTTLFDCHKPDSAPAMFSLSGFEKNIRRAVHTGSCEEIQRSLSLLEKELSQEPFKAPARVKHGVSSLAVSVLAIQNNDEETSALIVDLSEMLQYTFRSFAEKTLLCDEIGWVSNYLHIMSKRYDNLFCTRMDIDENLEDALVPKLILQPLVENAILHGFRQTKKDGLLILISGQEDKILFIIKDNGCGMTCTQPDQGSGHVGLSNVHRRLSLLYGENYTFEISSAPGEGTCVRIRIPLELQETS